MWNIVNTVRLLRKPSKRGEGDFSSGEDSSFSKGRKVERRESTKLGAGASKFLKSLRPNTGNASVALGGNSKKVSAIALKEFHCEGFSSEGKRSDDGKLNHRVVPERSQSFQEKRTSFSNCRLPVENERALNDCVCSVRNGSNKSHGKTKQPRTQSFACSNSNDRVQSIVEHDNSRKDGVFLNDCSIYCKGLLSQKMSIKKQEYGCQENQKTKYRYSNLNISTSNPSCNLRSKGCETIYENLGVINGQKRKQRISKFKHFKSFSQDSDVGSCRVPEFSSDNKNESTNSNENITTLSSVNNRSIRKFSCHLQDEVSKPTSDPEPNNLIASSTDSIDCSLSSPQLSMSYPSLSVHAFRDTHKPQAIRNQEQTRNAQELASSSKTTSSATLNNNCTWRYESTCQLHRICSKSPANQMKLIHGNVPHSPPLDGIDGIRQKYFEKKLDEYSRSANVDERDQVKNQLDAPCESPLIIESVEEVNVGSSHFSTLPARGGDRICHDNGQLEDQLVDEEVKGYSSRYADSNWIGGDDDSKKVSSGVESASLDCFKYFSGAKSVETIDGSKSLDVSVSKESLNEDKDDCFSYGECGSGPSERNNDVVKLRHACLYPVALAGHPHPMTKGSPSHSNSRRVGHVQSVEEIHTDTSDAIIRSSSAESCNPNKCSGATMSTRYGASSHASSSMDGPGAAPVRDTSSLKQMRYGPGHEKYPSWPIPVTSAEEIDPTGDLIVGKNVGSNGCSFRSKSWTEHTDYPKEKLPTYSRPYMKRVNQGFTQQLKTVVEKCEKLQTLLDGPTGYDPEYPNVQVNIESCNSSNDCVTNVNDLKSTSNLSETTNTYCAMNSATKASASSDFDLSSACKSNGCGSGSTVLKSVNDYDIPSPPERDISAVEGSAMVKPLTKEDLEVYAKKYEEMMNQYAHSEGYHSYMSSECSSYVSTGTPFLDQLRRESETSTQFWNGDVADSNDPLLHISAGYLTTGGRESVTTVVTNSSSNSSGTETHKWHDPNSDAGSSSFSCHQGSSWNQSLNSKMQAVNEVPDGEIHSSAYQHYQPQHDKSSSMRPAMKAKSLRCAHPASATKGLGSKGHTNVKITGNLKKFPLNTYTRPSELLLTPVNASVSKSSQSNERFQKNVTSPSCEVKTGPDRSEGMTVSPIIDTSKPPSVAERILELEQQAQHIKNATCAMGVNAVSTTKPGPVVSDKFVKSSSLNNIREKCQSLSPASMNDHSSKLNSASNGNVNLSTSLKTFWSSSDSSQPTSNFSVNRSSSVENNSVCNFSSAISYTYLDPDKRHKVADMTLKAIQKKALLSYYERHTGKQSSSSCSSSISSDGGASSRSPHRSNSPTKAVGEVNGSSTSGDAGSNSSLEKDSPFPTNRMALSLPRDLKQISSSLHVDRAPSPPPKSKNLSSNPSNKVSSSDHATLPSYSSHAAVEQSPLYPLNSIPCASNLKDCSSYFKASEQDEKVKELTLVQTSQEDRSPSKSCVKHSVPLGTMKSTTISSNKSSAWHLKNLPTESTSSPSFSTQLFTPGLSITNCSETTGILPPERPPKKPHLRNLTNRDDEGGNENSPPPPLPRAPIRSSPSRTSSTATAQSSKSLKYPSSSSFGGRCFSPDLDLPLPPPPLSEEDEVLNDEPLPPPPSLTEVQNLSVTTCSQNRSQPTSLSSYLHKDSYLSHTKERSLGYEGRYRRTLSPSGSGSKSTRNSTKQASDSCSSGRLDSTLSPSAWERYHNIRPPSTTVIFTSHELEKNGGNRAQPLFHRSISCENSLFTNKTGFSLNSSGTIQPPVAQVAPLRDTNVEGADHSSHYNLVSVEKVEESCEVAKGHQVPDIPIYYSSRAEECISALSVKPDEFIISSSPTGSSSKKVSSCSSSESSASSASSSTLVSPSFGEEDEDMKQNSQFSQFYTQEVATSKNSVEHDPDSSIGTYVPLPSLKVSPYRLETDNEKIMWSSKSANGGKSNYVIDAASQTESERVDEENVVNEYLANGNEASEGEKSKVGGGPTYLAKKRTQVELECEELTLDLVRQLPQGDKLHDILVPLPERKTTADYMEGLFSLELNAQCDGMEGNEEVSSLTTKSSLPQSIVPNNKRTDSRCNGHAPLPADSAYFTTSESKAKFLTRYGKDMAMEGVDNDDREELDRQKEELVSRISRKLKILKSEQLDIRDEIRLNEQLGQSVVERVKETAKRNEFDKFKLHVEEIEKITSLLLGLSGRLARAENALMNLDESNPQEKKTLESKRDRLQEQLNEAKVLKESIDRRSAQVSQFLQKYLTAEEFVDYNHFVKMKAKLIIDSKEIDDKIKLGDEQMMALQDTLKTSMCCNHSC